MTYFYHTASRLAHAVAAVLAVMLCSAGFAHVSSAGSPPTPGIAFVHAEDPPSTYCPVSDAGTFSAKVRPDVHPERVSGGIVVDGDVSAVDALVVETHRLKRGSGHAGGASAQFLTNPLPIMPQTLSKHQERWNEIVEDPSLQDLPYKVETNARGQLILSPHKRHHSVQQKTVIHHLDALLTGGGAYPEFPVETADGVKQPDVVWVSEGRLEEMDETGDPPRSRRRSASRS